MDRKRFLRFAGLALALVLLLGTTALLAGDEPAGKEKKDKIYYTGNIYQTGRAGMPVLRVQFYIEDFSTPEEAAQLAQTLRDSGDAGLASALSKAKEKGNIQINNRLGYKMGFIRKIPTPDGGYIIRMATDRPISIPEVWGDTRSTDYTIGVVELKLDAEDKGEGVLIYAAKVKFNEQGMLEIETYGIAPAKIVNLKKWK